MDGINDWKCLSDEMIYDILARYEGLRLIEDRWLGRQLLSPDFLSADTTSSPDDFIDAHRVIIHLAEDSRDTGSLSRNEQTAQTHVCVELNADQRGRFHAAIVYVWTLNEIRWVLTSFEYPVTFHVQVEVLQRCRARLENSVHNAMLDDLDRLAVFRFLYHHLLSLYGGFWQIENSSKLPLTLLTNFSDVALYSAR